MDFSYEQLTNRATVIAYLLASWHKRKVHQPRYQ